MSSDFCVTNSCLRCVFLLRSERSERAATESGQKKNKYNKTKCEFSNSSFFTRMHHLTRVHCATFYQSALRHEQQQDDLRVDSSENFALIYL